MNSCGHLTDPTYTSREFPLNIWELTYLCVYSHFVIQNVCHFDIKNTFWHTKCEYVNLYVILTFVYQNDTEGHVISYVILYTALVRNRTPPMSFRFSTTICMSFCELCKCNVVTFTKSFDCLNVSQNVWQNVWQNEWQNVIQNAWQNDIQHDEI